MVFLDVFMVPKMCNSFGTRGWFIISKTAWWWLVAIFGIFPLILGCFHHPNWLIFFSIYWVAFIIPIDEVIFFRGVAQPPTRKDSHVARLAHEQSMRDIIMVYIIGMIGRFPLQDWPLDGFGCCPSVRHAHAVMSPLSWGLLVVENVIRGTEAEQSHVSKWHFLFQHQQIRSCVSTLGRYEHPCCLLYPVPFLYLGFDPWTTVDVLGIAHGHSGQAKFPVLWDLNHTFSIFSNHPVTHWAFSRSWYPKIQWCP